MALTAEQLNRATLARQLLLEREPLAAPDAVRRVVALQAQEPALRTFAPLVHAPTGATWAYGPTPSFLAAPAGAGRDSPNRSLARLVWRYLEGFGPATPADFGQFALQRKPAVTAAFTALNARLRHLEGPDGEALFDVPDGPRPAGDTPAPARLLPMWDSTLLAWADRRRIIDAADRPVVTRRNGDVLPTLLVDGRVAGLWRTVEGGIEASAFRPLPDDAWSALAAEARSLLAFLAPRDPVPYRRFNRWWTDLPATQVEILPA